ncbi:MAG: thiamine pyrophosphate-binding protein [Bacteriovoracaceae bacterium]|jgi:acetolactate synthase I/II/III large subunit|nr:thiamine pyrophosphate-binding protein [Bacteriovoracaceae bacterium]
MKKTGGYLVKYALEQVGVKFTFGIPGVHNTEIYDELNKSEQIHPILVTHELGASFAADGVSRTSDSIGTLMIVPAAGTTHASSGIAEAFLDGVPMLVISGGIRRDSGKHYQLHQIEQSELTKGFVKNYYLVTEHDKIIPTIYQAYHEAISGTPGPVFVEIPGELQLFQGEVGELPEYQEKVTHPFPSQDDINKACDLLIAAKNPCLYLGWGSKECSELTIEIAELLRAPVATTMQGLSVFPSNHPLHTGFGFGPSSVPAAENAFSDCDCLLAVGLRFAELATGSYGMNVCENLIHIDIDSEVIGKNYPAKVGLVGDAKEVLGQLLEVLRGKDVSSIRNKEAFCEKIKSDKKSYLAEWTGKTNDSRVSPGHFFTHLRNQMDDDAYTVVDDGHHTFLTAELLPIHHPKHFISPTDYNAMGYCVPAAIGCKLANPDKQVIGIVGDGAFLMTGMETITATSQNLGIVYFVFHDGELGQISAFQQIPLNRKTCTVLGDIKIEGFAIASGAAYFEMKNDGEIESIISKAFKESEKGRPVIVDVRIDYSQKTRFTKGAVKSNLSRFPLGEKVRFIGRAVKRHTLG